MLQWGRAELRGKGKKTPRAASHRSSFNGAALNCAEKAQIDGRTKIAVYRFNGAALNCAEKVNQALNQALNPALLQWGRAELRGKGKVEQDSGAINGLLQWGRAELRGKGSLSYTKYALQVRLLQWGRAELRGKGSPLFRACTRTLRFNGAALNCAEKVQSATGPLPVLTVLQWGRAELRGKGRHADDVADFAREAASMGPR